MQHQDKSKQENAAFIEEEQLWGTSEAVRDPQKLNADEIEDILIRGYDDNGFYVNDPNRRSNSGRQWDYDTLYPQIRNLWVLQK